MKDKTKAVIIFMAVIWAVYVIDLILPINFNKLGILPRSFSGLWGIIFAPFLHGGLYHIIGNSIPLFILTWVLVTFYEKIALQVMIGSTLLGGALVWLLARKAYHVGASGLIFSLAAFLIAVGVFKKNLKSLAIALVISIVYGISMLFSFFRIQGGVSWEGHLFGAVAGVLMALIESKKTGGSEETKAQV